MIESGVSVNILWFSFFITLGLLNVLLTQKLIIQRDFIGTLISLVLSFIYFAVAGNNLLTAIVESVKI